MNNVLYNCKELKLNIGKKKTTRQGGLFLFVRFMNGKLDHAEI